LPSPLFTGRSGGQPSAKNDAWASTAQNEQVEVRWKGYPQTLQNWGIKKRDKEDSDETEPIRRVITRAIGLLRSESSSVYICEEGWIPSHVENLGDKEDGDEKEPLFLVAR
jgi:hypothetical protein